jgi:uncharacterized Zn-finger protein
MKTKKQYKEIKGEWKEYLEPEYFLTIICPYCKDRLSEYHLNVWGGRKINRLVKCPKCSEIFKLKVKEF